MSDRGGGVSAGGGGSDRGGDLSDRRFDKLPRRQLDGGLAVIEATTHRSRRRGLMRLDRLGPELGLHIPGTGSIHTFAMRFALDLIWLDRRGTVVRVDRDVPPRRLKFCARARSVIETEAGRADAFLAAGAGTEAGAPLGSR